MNAVVFIHQIPFNVKYLTPSIKIRMSIEIIGTGHIFEKSVREVRESIQRLGPDVVALELDDSRFRGLAAQGFSMEFQEGDVDFRSLLVKVLRGGSLPVFIQSLLGGVQRELGKRYGIKPGADMCAAVLAAREVGGRILLIDRDIEVTINHLLAIPLREKIALFTSRDEDLEVMVGLMGSNLENLLEEGVLVKVMDSLKRNTPGLYAALVDERDRYMALQLDSFRKKNPDSQIIAVVGAGHRQGIKDYLKKLEGGYEISMHSLVSMRKTPIYSGLFLIFAVVLAYILTKIRFRGK